MRLVGSAFEPVVEHAKRFSVGIYEKTEPDEHDDKRREYAPRLDSKSNRSVKPGEHEENAKQPEVRPKYSPEYDAPQFPGIDLRRNVDDYRILWIDQDVGAVALATTGVGSIDIKNAAMSSAACGRALSSAPR